MLEQIITKEVISPIFIVIIAILFYSFIKKVVIKMFRASSKFGVHKKSMTIMNLIINIIKSLNPKINKPTTNTKTNTIS